MPVIHIISFVLTVACRAVEEPTAHVRRVRLRKAQPCPESHFSAGQSEEDSGPPEAAGEQAAFPTWRDHLHLGAAAHCLAATVGAARVGALVPSPQVVDQQSAIWRLVDTVAIGLYRQPVPGGERP